MAAPSYSASAADFEVDKIWAYNQLSAYFVECGTKREVEALTDAYSGICAEGLTVYAKDRLIYRERYDGPTLVVIEKKDGNTYIKFPTAVEIQSFQPE